ncbi:hypothetical protein KQ51_00987 [Candidatus Izimaplasma bacterium HR1]|jgi:uncharacterized ion transporter superfamily protein YfcC|uniref:YfcC family protein n=1 Tax=Candidatus Izimoplasma sp. HR1 TaxID=1541959 RepID=UPI0004F69569|nr:hypothetical protein KQ51_00987 [Candidatus Izimaplasma bacterium HR1]
MNDNLANIQKKAFFSAIIILFVLLVLTGIMTFFIPSGSYEYELIEGVRTIIPDSFHYTNEGNISFFRIFTAPFEVFAAEGSSILIAIILFLLIIGGSIKILNKIGVIEHMIFVIIKRFKDNKYLLLALITLIFMSIGALIGVFEEVVPLVPIMIVLSRKLGWDTKIGLGMSILAAGFGFSAAITNPFTIGVAQELANLPIFSGFLYRLVIFVIVYGVLITFLIINAKKVDKYPKFDDIEMTYHKPNRKSLIWTGICFSLMIISIVLSPFVTFLQDYNLILIAFYFLLAGIGAGLLSDLENKKALKIYLSGSLDMAPGVLLIMLATGVKHLITISGVMDTILFEVVSLMSNESSFVVIIGAFFFTLIANFFIGSGSAKAFIIIPILNPLLDLSNISRQLGVLAFQLGDGFSNMFYPTNAVLLVALGLSSFAYTKWFKWTLILQIIVILLSVLFLFVGLQIGY